MIAAGIAMFELVHAEGGNLPAFSAGSHIDVEVDKGVTRQYSLCNDSGESHRYQIAVLKEPASRGGSIAMHESVRVGDELAISPPRNHFPLAHGAAESLLLAGGIGITPMLCMAERLSALGASFRLHYCTRSRERTAFLERIQASQFSDRVKFHFDDEEAAQKLDLRTALFAASSECHLYTCGPKGFMDAVLGTARSTGWNEERLHYEFFNAEPVKLASDGSFEVKLASSGRVIPVAADQTVIAALRAHDVEVTTSCEQGVCGTCLTRVLTGIPDHRDMYLTPDEQAANDQFLPCCSRAKTAQLVLDL